jgi:hypothetical protein
VQPLEQIREKLAGHPDWSVVDEGQALTVTARQPTGFDVSFAEDEEGYVVYFGSWHQHFARTEASSALECFAFGLSDSARLRVHSKGGVDYRWTLEALENGTWHTSSTTGLLLYPFWRRRQVRYLKNVGLPHGA